MDLTSLFILLILVMNAVILFRAGALDVYLDKVLRKVAEASRIDSAQGRAWEWRFEDLDSVDYIEMVFQFWRPFDSFWEDTSFMRKRGEYE